MAARNFRNMILCDAVYVDKTTNKPVIAGVYFGDILLPSFPGVVRAAVYGEYIPDRDGNVDIELSVYVDGKRLGNGTIHLADAVSGRSTMLLVPDLGIVAEKPSVLLIKASIDGSRAVNVLTKHIDIRRDSV
jgi:hypothetical protein